MSEQSIPTRVYTREEVGALFARCDAVLTAHVEQTKALTDMAVDLRVWGHDLRGLSQKVDTMGADFNKLKDDVAAINIAKGTQNGALGVKCAYHESEIEKLWGYAKGVSAWTKSLLVGLLLTAGAAILALVRERKLP